VGVWLTKLAGLHKLDSVYYCMECLRTFLFESDIGDHQNDTGHRGVRRIQLYAFDEAQAA